MAELTYQEQREMKRKLAKDWRTIKKYKEQLQAQRKEYAQIASGYSMSGRRSRALAVGECVIQCMENLRKLNGEKNLLDGTLFWNIIEERVKDTDGRKGFKYSVVYHVKSDEPAYTEEQIRDEIKKTAEQIRQETGEMFGEISLDEEPPFEPDEE